MDPNSDNTCERLESLLGYSFRDRTLLAEALTHPSRANEVQGGRDNQRLEFFGDAVLAFLISHLLFRRFPNAREGELSRMRAALVDEANLARVAAGLGLGSYLSLGKGEAKSGGRNKKSILADAYEALLAAIYLDGGVTAARKVINRHFADGLEEQAVSAAYSADCKTELQEYLQATAAITPCYNLTEAAGPDHDRLYTFSVLVNGATVGTGQGKSKKEAQQAAAREALAFLKR